MNSTVKTVVFWLVIVLSGVLLWQVVKGANSGAKEREINFSEFLSQVDQGNVSEVTIVGQEVRGKFKNDKAGFHTTVMAGYTDMIKELRDKGVNITVKDAQGGGWPTWLLNLGALHLAGRAVVHHDPPDADRRQQGAVVRQEPRPPALHAAEEGDVQGRRRRG